MVVMTDDWQPCEKFEDQARISGIDPDLLTSDALAKFRIFYDGQERLANRWNLALIDWLKRERHANRRASAPKEDPLAFTEENRPKHGPYALFKPGPKKTPLTDEDRDRIAQLRRQAFGDAA